MRFVEGPQSSKGRPRRKAGTPFTDMWQQVDRAVSEVIDKTTFAELTRAWTDRQNRHVHTWEI
jgi:DNA-binding IscR family transcriptional regulator